MRECPGVLRNEYLKASLDGNSVNVDPFVQFKKWLDEAVNNGTMESNAMILSTAGSDGQPTQRIVLLKGFDDRGFVFYTDYESTKGKQIASNPLVSVLFPWLAIERQVIITGTAEKVSRETSAGYFHSRPKGSQLGAWVSRQSEKISSRSVLEEKLTQVEADFSDAEVPLPDTWGGYTIIPSTFEFWQGRENRLHDRMYYEKAKENWRISRLSP